MLFLYPLIIRLSIYLQSSLFTRKYGNLSRRSIHHHTKSIYPSNLIHDSVFPSQLPMRCTFLKEFLASSTSFFDSCSFTLLRFSKPFAVALTISKTFNAPCNKAFYF